MNRVLLRLYFFLCFMGPFAFAFHPNEGPLKLEVIIQEALSNNLEVKEAEANLHSIDLISRGGNAAFFPALSVEGGPLVTKFDNEKHSGIAAYGKAEWNIFRGGRDSAEKSNKAIQAKFAVAQYEFTKAKVARDAARFYYEMLFILESIALKEKAIEMNRDQMKLARAKKSSGFISDADVIEFELREATLNSDLKQLRQDQNSKSRELSLIMGRDAKFDNLSAHGHLGRNSLLPEKEKIFALISKKNPEILQNRAELEINEGNTSVAKAGFLPTIDVLAKYGKLANEEKVFSNKNNYFVGVFFTLPIFSGFSSLNELKSSRFEAQKSEFQLKKQENFAQSEAERLYSQLISIRERLDLEEKTLSRSEEYYKITTGEYRRGVKNSPDMVTASERLIDARIRNLEFRKEYQITYLNLLGLAGLNPNEAITF